MLDRNNLLLLAKILSKRHLNLQSLQAQIIGLEFFLLSVKAYPIFYTHTVLGFFEEAARVCYIRSLATNASLSSNNSSL
jgi:hypothetical protein